MKQRPILISAIILTLIIELILIILVYNKVGTERLPSQIGRLTIQLILIFWVLSTKSNVGLFLLAGYHIVSGIFGLSSKGSTELLGQILIGFHIIIGIVIYFHDWIENKIEKKHWVTMYNHNYGGFDYVRIHSELLKPVLNRKVCVY